MKISSTIHRTRYVPEFDGIRGASVWVILLAHAEFQFSGSGAVVIFFVLSGYLITTLLLREFSEAGSISLVQFYYRRFLRLLPALVVMLSGWSLYLYLFGKDVRRFFRGALLVLVYTGNFDRWVSWHPLPYLRHAWTLAVEEHFYFFWPLLLAVLLKRGITRWNLFILTIVIALSSWGLRSYLVFSEFPLRRVYRGTDTRIDAILIGCALAILVSSKIISTGTERPKWLQYVTPVALCGLIAMTVSDVTSVHFYYWVSTLQALAGAVLILHVLYGPSDWFGRILRHPFLRQVGVLSYGTYLWHYPIMRVLMKNGWSPLPVFVVGSFLALCCAAVSYRFVEKPVLLRRLHRP